LKFEENYPIEVEKNNLMVKEMKKKTRFFLLQQ
jgi:hypothetical protein